ncbi:PAS domain S-box protein [Candidatus Woesearchaeota archaeon]|jgi:PAS domain S-box-containing protein|nr:PAS domain S-box protein [Candidatus Woesearchaeota archaeon]
MKIGTILILSFLIIGIIGSIGGSYYQYLGASEIITNQVIDHLESTASLMENSIESAISEEKTELEIMARLTDITSKELNEILNAGQDFYELFVMDSTGKIITSTTESQIGIDRSNDEYFINARKNTYVKPSYFSEDTQRNAISISTPYNGGVLVARMELKYFDQFVSERNGLGETGEGLLAYSDGEDNPVFFTERRFQDQAGEESASQKQILPISEALNKNEIVVTDSYDYRGEKVIAITRYIDEVEMGLVVKMDRSEAIGVAENELIRTSIILIILIMIFVSLAGFLVSRSLSKPIKKITKDVNEITKGRLDIQLPKSKIYELQNLADSLNRILASLKLAILRTGIHKSAIGIGEAVKAKKEAEDKYQILYEKSMEAIMMLGGGNWNFISGNPATLKLFGLKDEKELLSKTPGELSPKYQPNKKLSSEESKKMIQLALKNGSHSFKWKHKRVDNKEFYASVMLTKIPLGGKDVMQATVRNITNEVQAKNRYKELFDSINEGVAVYRAVENGKDFVFEDYNKRAEVIDNIKREKLIGKKLTEVFPGVKESGIFDKLVKTYKTGKSQNWDSAAYEDKRLGKTIRRNYTYKLPSGEIVATYRAIKAKGAKKK